jgi:hypothetical protein
VDSITIKTGGGARLFQRAKRKSVKVPCGPPSAATATAEEIAVLHGHEKIVTSAPLAPASSRHQKTRPPASGTLPRARRSRSCAVHDSSAETAAFSPTGSASSRRHGTRRPSEPMRDIAGGIVSIIKIQNRGGIREQSCRASIMLLSPAIATAGTSDSQGLFHALANPAA